MVDSPEAEDVYGLVISISKLLVEAANGISQIVCERGSSDHPTDKLTPALSHVLARVDTRHFLKVL